MKSKKTDLPSPSTFPSQRAHMLLGLSPGQRAFFEKKLRPYFLKQGFSLRVSKGKSFGYVGLSIKADFQVTSLVALFNEIVRCKEFMHDLIGCNKRPQQARKKGGAV